MGVVDRKNVTRASILSDVRKTVWVLGAGASFDTGAPLLADFLRRSRLMKDGDGNLSSEEVESFENVFEWIETLRKSAYYVDVVLDNLEHVFSLAEMGRQIAHHDCSRIVDDLLVLIDATIRNTCQFSNIETPRPHRYSYFWEALKEIDESKRELGADLFEKNHDSIITFNYDLAIDYAARKLDGGSPRYRLDDNEPPGISVLKLHGSLNWGKCSLKSEHKIVPILVRLIELHPNKVWYKGVLGDSVVDSCPQCAEENVHSMLAPAIIPPTWSKIVGHPQIASVWNHAVRDISNAYQIVVIGYSMPETDTFFKYLLTLGLRDNPHLKDIIVVNPDCSESLRARYTDAFSKGLQRRNGLKFVNSTFADVCGGVSTLRRLLETS